MASAEENGFLRSLWSHWLVLMSGIISVLVSVGPYPITLGTFWPNLRWVRGFPNSTAWLVIGCGCLFGACYLAWKDERKKVHRLRTEVEELHGQPEVTLQCFAAAYRGPEFHGAFEFRLSNANDHVALNVKISHIPITIWDNREELKAENRKLSGGPQRSERAMYASFSGKRQALPRIKPISCLIGLKGLSLLRESTSFIFLIETIRGAERARFTP